MIQTSVAVPIPVRRKTDSGETALLDSLLAFAGDIGNVRALIVAEHGLDLMCGLIRRGCLAATILRVGDKPDADDYDLVLVPYVAALASPDAMIQLVRRSLAPHGRLIVGARNSKEAAGLARRLRLNGFTGLRATPASGLTLLRANLRSVQ